MRHRQSAGSATAVVLWTCVSWSLWDFKTAHAFEGKQFLSVCNNYEYDCAGRRMRMIATPGSSQQMGRGTVVASSDAVLAWESAGTNSISMSHWKSACGR